MQKITTRILGCIVGILTLCTALIASDIGDLRGQFIERKIDTLVMGGLRVPSDKHKHWIVSPQNCLVVNNDQKAKPDFIADAFNLESIESALYPVLQLIETNSAYRLSRICYEHLGDGFTTDNQTTFARLIKLLKPGGVFEYSSYWLYMDVSSDLLSMGASPDRLFHKIMGFDRSSGDTRITYEGEEELSSREQALNKTEEDLKETQKKLSSTQLEIYLGKQIKPFTDLHTEFLNFSNKMNSLLKSRDDQKRSSIDQQNLIIGLYEEYLPKILSFISRGEILDNPKITQALIHKYRRVAHYVERLKLYRDRHIAAGKRSKNTKFTTDSSEVFHGFDRIITRHFSQSAEPLIVKWEGEHQTYFPATSKIHTYIQILRNIGLEDIRLTISKANNQDTQQQLYSFTLTGVTGS